MTRILYTMLLGLLFSGIVSAQKADYIQQEFTWTAIPLSFGENVLSLVPQATPGAIASNGIPSYEWQMKLEAGQTLSLEPNYFALYENITQIEELHYLKGLDLSPAKAEPQLEILESRGEQIAVVRMPLVELDENGTYRKINFLTLKYELKADNAKQLKKGVNWKTSSLLNSGQWAKVFTETDGVHSISHSFASSMNIGLDGADVTKISMYGYPGGMLPEHNHLTQYDDLEEIAIQVQDNNNNGKFDQGDQILFYGQSPNADAYNGSISEYAKQTHHYSTVCAYFIHVNSQNGKRFITHNSSAQAANYATNHADVFLHFEENKKNILKSGKLWYWHDFDRTQERKFNVSLDGKVASEPITLISRGTAHSNVYSAFTISLNGSPVLTHPFPGLTLYDYASQFANFPSVVKTSTPAPDNFELTYFYTKPVNLAIGYLDYFEIHYRKNLSGDNQFVFSDGRSIGSGIYNEYKIQNADAKVWEVTDPLNVGIQQTVTDGSGIKFIRENDELRKFLYFKPENAIPVNVFHSVQNQNLHSLSNIEYLIVTHADMMPAANRLADFHKTQNSLSVAVATTDQVYNEFSSGIADVTAIRNFARFLFENGTPSKRLKYLLLFGDASYDFKGIAHPGSNIVPTFETDNSVEPVGSYCSDDFFSLLDESEGGNIESGMVDIGVGRFPVSNLEQANQMVDKVIRYHDPKSLGEWRNLISVFADDEDSNIHLNDGETYSNIIENTDQDYTVRKIYADAYRQITVGTGQRYPDVTREFDRSFESGSLIVNYSGHGGEALLGHEKFLEIPQINSWENSYNMPLFVTATCEFSRYDNPGLVSAGELSVLNPKGGAIAMYTTVRLVYAYPNRVLNANLYDSNAFTYTPGQEPALGDVYRLMKNKTNTNMTNTRSFTLLGDPAMKLAYPKHKVVTTSVNGKPAASADSINALTQVSISGQVQDQAGNLLSSFNGTVDVTVFGSRQKFKTLVNDPSSKEQEVEAYTSVVYKGKASVKQGEFSITYITPLDLPVSGGFGKISYYAQNGSEDANGSDLLYMQPDIDPAAQVDNEGPKIRLFMNDTTFLYGGITDENPRIYALVYDESGINTTGLGIGRNITGEVDQAKELLILNEYYTSNTDDFTRGVVEYPLKDMAEGVHDVKIKVWDVYNNSAEARTQFVVAKSAKLAIQNLISYPNPFVDSVMFRFEHNQTGKTLQIEVNIYDSKGNFVTTLNASSVQSGAVFDQLTWYGEKQNGSQVSPGLYLFKLHVKTLDGQEVYESERIVYIPNP
ncbi:MAG: type IX secretion system sortase PorU [Bacteroidetes bacterium]|nr:MAG: type IX secretion system sortase PorU [Bacteroidota bacterium]